LPAGTAAAWSIAAESSSTSRNLYARPSLHEVLRRSCLDGTHKSGRPRATATRASLSPRRTSNLIRADARSRRCFRFDRRGRVIDRLYRALVQSFAFASIRFARSRRSSRENLVAPRLTFARVREGRRPRRASRTRRRA
jgi:hypothetical protein